MPFNLIKSEFLIVTNKSVTYVNDYKLQRVSSAKYLGVTISSNQSWYTQELLGVQILLCLSFEETLANVTEKLK